MPVKAGPRACHSCARLCAAAVIAVLVLAIGAHAGAWRKLGPFGGVRRAAGSTGIVGWMFAKQAFFYRALAGLIRAAKTDGSALWGLMGISFVYGIFHAAGPGHGKAVISSYLVANEETWRRGIVLSFASALMQSLVADRHRRIAAVAHRRNGQDDGHSVRGIEIVSYALIVAGGRSPDMGQGHAAFSPRCARSERHPNRRSGRRRAIAHHATRPRLRPRPCDHHEQSSRRAMITRARRMIGISTHHDDDEEEDVSAWGHAHGPEPEELAGPGGWRRGLSAIVAVGLRPCSGAIIVLVFALAQGLFWAGVASTFVMGLGTAITVAAIATLAVGARRGEAVRRSARRLRHAGRCAASRSAPPAW